MTDPRPDETVGPTDDHHPRPEHAGPDSAPSGPAPVAKVPEESAQDAPGSDAAEYGGEPPWMRISIRHLVPGLLGNLWSFGLFAIVVFVIHPGEGVPWYGWLILASGAMSVYSVIMELLTHKFRINGPVVEDHRVFFSVKRSKIRIGSIRSITVTQAFMQRIVGLADVKIETSTSMGELTISGMLAAGAREFKRELDEHPTRTTSEQVPTLPTLAEVDASVVEANDASPTPTIEPDDAPPSHSERFVPRVLASMKRTWVWRSAIFGPGILSILGVLLPLNMFGDVLWPWLARTLLGDRADGFISWLEDDDADFEFTWEVAQQALTEHYLPVALGALATIPLGYVINVAFYLAQHHRFTLTQENPTTLVVKEGLFQTRQQTVDLRRMRGVFLEDGIFTRMTKTALMKAMLTTKSIVSNEADILPRVPASVARDTADVVLTERGVFDLPLARHGGKAARRMLIGSVTGLWLFALVAAGLVWWFGAPWVATLWVFALLVVRVPWAIALYLQQGYTLTDTYVVYRQGYVMREHKAVERAGVISWSLEEDPIQRFLGIGTLTLKCAGDDVLLRDLPRETAMGLVWELCPQHLDDFTGSSAAVTAP